jgi:cysteine desulfurase
MAWLILATKGKVAREVYVKNLTYCLRPYHVVCYNAGVTNVPVYLDCNATTPIEPDVLDLVIHYMRDEYGNAGSRTHEFGARAKQAVQKARDQVAALVDASRDEVIFTSGATESNNLAILGLAPHGERSGRKHIVTTAIEHKAVLEPVELLRQRGFEVTIVPPTSGGRVDPEAVRDALRPDTLLVSVMHVNNETGVIQPLDGVADVLRGHEAYLHVDAAQGFGKELTMLRNKRIELISVSGHKIYAPKGVGALIIRRRDMIKVPLAALMVGGGQERGLRPGTLPVALIAGLGLAAELAWARRTQRASRVAELLSAARQAFVSLGGEFVGDQNHTISTTASVAVPGVDSEAALLALQPEIAASNGAACTSQNYTASHVLTAMGLPLAVIRGAIRFSWSHLSESPDWTAVVRRIREVS